MSSLNDKKSVSDIFIKRPVMTMLLALSALLFGIYSYKAMPVNDLPGVDYPVIQVTASYPGANPTIMATNIASPLEQQFMQIPGIEMITSNNSFGATKIVLQFNLSKSIDAAATDVQSAIQRATGNLPSDLPSRNRPENFHDRRRFESGRLRRSARGARRGGYAEAFQYGNNNVGASRGFVSHYEHVWGGKS